MPRLKEAAVVEATAHPAVYHSALTGLEMPYRRISDLYLTDRHLGTYRVVPSIYPNRHPEKLSLSLDTQTAARLIGFFGLSLAEVNCHIFARHMAGVELTGKREDFEPHLLAKFDTLIQAESLDIGQAASVMVEGWGLVHSLAGLGKDVPYALQVISSSGEFGIVDYKDTMEFYARLHPRSEVTLKTEPNLK